MRSDPTVSGKLPWQADTHNTTIKNVMDETAIRAGTSVVSLQIRKEDKSLRTLKEQHTVVYYTGITQTSILRAKLSDASERLEEPVPRCYESRTEDFTHSG